MTNLKLWQKRGGHFSAGPVSARPWRQPLACASPGANGANSQDCAATRAADGGEMTPLHPETERGGMEPVPQENQEYGIKTADRMHHQDRPA